MRNRTLFLKRQSTTRSVWHHTVVALVTGALRENRLDHLQDILKRIRDTGTLVGLSVHDPRLLHIAEDEDWDIDYYMTGLYNLHGGAEKFREKFGYAALGEIYAREDRNEMCKAIQRTDKPCLIFKVLAAGQNHRKSRSDSGRGEIRDRKH